MVSATAAERFLACPWLAELDSVSLREALNVMSEGRAPSGAVLLAQGQPNDHIIFLMEGSATVSRTLVGGSPERLTTLKAPSVFGLTSFFRPQPPGFTVRADEPVWFLRLDHPAHDLLRRVDLRASEQLALAAVRVLADRFDLLDQMVSADLAAHPEDQPRNTEWSEFRSRLFEEASL